MNKYKLTGKAYPESFHVPIESHVFNTEMSGIKSKVTAQIDYTNVVSCFVESEAKWDPHELMGHIELVIQGTLNSISFVSGITTEVFINHVECHELNIDLSIEMDYQGVISSGVPQEFMSRAFLLIDLCTSEHGWHLTRALNEFRLALRHRLDAGFFCYRSIECLRVYCRDRYNLQKEKVQWEKLRDISGVDRTEIDEIKKFSDPNRHGDFQGISGQNRETILHSTRKIIDNFFRGIF